MAAWTSVIEITIACVREVVEEGGWKAERRRGKMGVGVGRQGKCKTSRAQGKCKNQIKSAAKEAKDKNDKHTRSERRSSRSRSRRSRSRRQKCQKS